MHRPTALLLSRSEAVFCLRAQRSSVLQRSDLSVPALYPCRDCPLIAEIVCSRDCGKSLRSPPDVATSLSRHRGHQRQLSRN